MNYRLAVRFLFEASGALGVQPELAVQPFTARAARNDYEVRFLPVTRYLITALLFLLDSMGVTRPHS